MSEGAQWNAAEADYPGLHRCCQSNGCLRADPHPAQDNEKWGTNTQTDCHMMTFLSKRHILVLYLSIFEPYFFSLKGRQNTRCRCTDMVRFARFTWDSEGACPLMKRWQSNLLSHPEKGGSDILAYKLALIASSPSRGTAEHPDIPDPRTCRCIHTHARTHTHTHSITIAGYTKPEARSKQNVVNSQLSRALHPAACHWQDFNLTGEMAMHDSLPLTIAIARRHRRCYGSKGWE